MADVEDSGSDLDLSGPEIAEGDGSLSQLEIDGLLDMGSPLPRPADLASIEDLENYLQTRASKIQEDEHSYGMFSQDPSTIRVSILNDDVKDNLKTLNEIREMNRAGGDEPIHIGGTELIQFSRCPNCKKTYSRGDLARYYRNPFVPEGLEKKRIQREDNRMRCSECGTFFIPSLVMLTRGGFGETVFLCKVQTIEAIESFYHGEMGRAVLTRKKENINRKRKSVALDIDADTLSRRPALMTNFLQYTPVKDTVRWLEPSDEDRLYLFDGNLAIV